MYVMESRAATGPAYLIPSLVKNCISACVCQIFYEVWQP